MKNWKTLAALAVSATVLAGPSQALSLKDLRITINGDSVTISGPNGGVSTRGKRRCVWVNGSRICNGQ